MITFTNKAAQEMLKRINVLLDKTYSNEKPFIGTFHALCAKILRKDGYNIGIPISFQIFDEADQLQTLKEALGKASLSPKEIKPRSALNAISQAKNEMIDENSYASFARGFFQENVAKIYPIYQSLMKNQNALDFDDLLLDTIRLFKKNPNILEKYQQIFRYILIDEYQDTNRPQYEITKLLSKSHNNINVVGDFSQSIYAFRGADFRNLERFKNDFKDCKITSLSQNYRSTQNILNAAYAIISKNTSHPILELWTENEEGDDITIYQAENEHAESEFIVNTIVQDKTYKKNSSLSDYAILYRTNAQSRTIEEVLLRFSIPYVLVGGVRFYERKEIKDVLSLLSYIANPKNATAKKRIEKLGKKKSIKFFEYEKIFNENEGIDKKTTLEILDEVVLAINYLDLYDQKDPQDKARLENIKELRSVALEFPNLLQFLENVSLVEQESFPDKNVNFKNTEKKEAITLMTLHAAKGLEFPTVFIIGMEEGLFPHSQSLLDNSELEEERRLCYVGITRAQKKLYLLATKRRLYFGQRTSNIMSRFIFDLPEEVLEKNFLNSKNLLNPDYL